MNDGQMLKTYLAALNDVRTSGAGGPETSYYPALSNLFNTGRTASAAKSRPRRA